MDLCRDGGDDPENLDGRRGSCNIVELLAVQAAAMHRERNSLNVSSAFEWFHACALTVSSMMHWIV